MTLKVSTATETAIGRSATFLATAGLLVDILQFLINDIFICLRLISLCNDNIG